MASTATILAVVNPRLAMASNWSMAFLIFLGVIGFAVVAAGKKRRNPVCFLCIFGIRIIILKFLDMNTVESVLCLCFDLTNA